MHFFFTTLKVVYVLGTPALEYVKEETLEQTRKRCKWDNNDYICRGHILNAEDTSSKKFLVNNFNNYIMVDSRMEESGKGKGKDIDGSSSVNMCGKPVHFEKDCQVKKNNGASAFVSGQGFKDPSPQQESRDAIFDENRFSSILRPKDIVSSSSGTQGRDLPVDGLRDEIATQYSYYYNIEENPKTFDEAMKARDVAFQKEVVDDEIGSIMENNTWFLSDLPPSYKPLGCKWIFKRKMKVDGTIDVGIVNSQRVLQLPRQSI
ncbi:hypothetical protein Tco_1166610 [Tanacetum coccineum]